MQLSLDQRISLKWCLLSFILGWVLSYVLMRHIERSTPLRRGIETRMMDMDGDGKADCMVVSSNGVTLTITYDRNNDGQFDYRDYYVNGRVVRSEADNDFDGQFDEWSSFYRGFPAAIETDADGDGRVDIFTYYTNGVVSYSAVRMTKGKDDLFTEYYNHGIRSKVVISKDGKERVLKCGRYGDIEFPEE